MMMRAREVNRLDDTAPRLGYKLPGLRWWIVGLVFGATVINILDRLSVSLLAPVICNQLHLTNLNYAEVGTWFLLAYTMSQGLSGWMHDRIASKGDLRFP